MLLKAWSLFVTTNPAPFKLYLVGPSYPPQLRKIQALISSLNLENSVVLLGPLEPASVQSLMSRSIANIFASTCENCPNILLEYLAARRPILSTIKEPMFEIGSLSMFVFRPFFTRISYILIDCYFPSHLTFVPT